MKYVEYGSQFTSRGIEHRHVWFVPNCTFGCVPPYVKGKPDFCWVACQPGRWPRPEDKSACELIVGMSLQPLGTNPA